METFTKTRPGIQFGGGNYHGVGPLEIHHACTKFLEANGEDPAQWTILHIYHLENSTHITAAKNDEHPIIFAIMSCFVDESWFDKYGEEINPVVDLVCQQEPWPFIIAATDLEVWSPCVFWPDNGAVCEVSDIVPQFTEDEWP